MSARGRRLREELQSAAPDVVTCLSPDELGRKALKQAVRLRIPTVVIEQRPLPTYLPDYYHQQVVDRAQRLVVTSLTQQALLQARGIAAQLWRPGIDPVLFHPGRHDPAVHAHWTGGLKLAVGYVGPLRRREGVHRLAGLSSIPFVQPVFIGSGRQRSWLRTHASGVFSNPGSGGIPAAIASLDILVTASRHDTDAPAVRAALASGVPVVVPARGGAAEIVADGETGLHFARTEALDLVRQVTRLVEDRDLRSRLGHQGRLWARDHGWGQAVGTLVADHLSRLTSAPTPQGS